MNPTPETQVDSQPDWLTAPRVAGLIAVFLFALYPGVILGTESFFFRDFSLFTYPFACYEHESFWRGEVPLWNPLNNCGIPFLAQWNTTVCYPPSLIYMIFPLPWSLNYFLLGHLALAGTGMFLLARHWTHNPTAAAVAAFAFALSGLLLNHVMSTGNLASLSWQPLVILAVEAAWQSGGTRKIIIAAFAGAMQMLAGSPEIILFTWGIIGALWLAHIWKEKHLLATTLRRLLMIVALIAALSAVQLLPFLDFIKHSQRDATYEVDPPNKGGTIGQVQGQPPEGDVLHPCTDLHHDAGAPHQPKTAVPHQSMKWIHPIALHRHHPVYLPPAPGVSYRHWPTAVKIVAASMNAAGKRATPIPRTHALQ